MDKKCKPEEGLISRSAPRVYGRGQHSQGGFSEIEIDDKWHPVCLVAAAPDLLEFSKLVMKWADTPEVNNNTQRVQSIMGLRAAIAKAEGK